MPYQSPISPGYSWYEDTVGDRPPTCSRRRPSANVVIVGGGFTGLSAAVHLAKAGTNVVLLEAHRFGDGASGRNGGQLGTGQRAGPEEMEKEFGFERAKALFDLAEEAKAHLLEFASVNGIEIDFCPGHMNVTHKPRELPEFVEYAEAAARFGYPHIKVMDAAETAERVGSTHYVGGTYDAGTGHIHPLKLVVGTARVAAEAGAEAVREIAGDGCLDERRQGYREDAGGHGHGAKMPLGDRRLFRRPRTGDGLAHHADRLLHRRDRAVGRRQPDPEGRRIGLGFRVSSCAISAG